MTQLQRFRQRRAPKIGFRSLPLMGYSQNCDIGERLPLSKRTVNTYVRRIFSKLHLTARSQAAVHAIRNGLI